MSTHQHAAELTCDSGTPRDSIVTNHVKRCSLVIWHFKLLQTKNVILHSPGHRLRRPNVKWNFYLFFYFCSKEVINCYRKWMCIGIQNINQYQSSVLIFKLKFKQIYENRVHVHFYHTTLCISAVFAVVRCLSVHLSDCHVGGLYPHSWRYRQTSCLAWYLHHSRF